MSVRHKCYSLQTIISSKLRTEPRTTALSSCIVGLLQGGSAIITDLLAFLGGWTKNRIDDLLGGRGRMGDVTRSHRNTLTTLHP